MKKVKLTNLLLALGLVVVLSLVDCTKSSTNEVVVDTPTPSLIIDSLNVKTFLDTADEATLHSMVLHSSGWREPPKPMNWPNRRWSPLKYFGPIYGNSPDVVLSGNRAVFSYGNYFSQNSDANIFKKYFGQNLPAGNPNTGIAATGFTNARLSLDRLEYSSRYGGTFKLIFLPAEDMGFEFVEQGIYYDIKHVEMHAFIRPINYYFNPNGLIQNSLAAVEFNVADVVSYDLQNNSITIRRLDPLPQLIGSLDQMAKTIRAQDQTFGQDASRLAYGLVHAEHWDRIGQTNTVTAIEITDGFFFPTTAVGMPMIYVSLKISDIKLDTEPGGEEISVSIGAPFLMAGSDPFQIPGIHHDFSRIGNREATPWTNIGVWDPNWDCRSLLATFINFSIVESDTFIDDYLETDPMAIQVGPFDCNQFEVDFAAGNYGVPVPIKEVTLQIMKGDKRMGSMKVQTRTTLLRA